MTRDRITVSGIREFRAALRDVNAELPRRVRLVLNEGADVIVTDARHRVERRTGRAAASYRAQSTQTSARIAIGGRKAPHAPWLDFGGRVGPGGSVRRPFIHAGRYVFPALARHKSEILQRLADAVGELAREAGFDRG